jgi:hypothetical protein
MKLIRNVAYNTKGHTFFIEDGVETDNYLEENLAIMTDTTQTLYATDQTPACFWITNPNNSLKGNRAAGCESYGFWFDAKAASTGSYYDPLVCPENT